MNKIKKNKLNKIILLKTLPEDHPDQIQEYSSREQRHRMPEENHPLIQDSY